jgi:hypothetical protein
VRSWIQSCHLKHDISQVVPQWIAGLRAETTAIAAHVRKLPQDRDEDERWLVSERGEACKNARYLARH